MAGQMNTVSGLYVALAGGVGVLSGAVVSGILETTRDFFRRKEARKQRAEDQVNFLAVEQRDSKRDAYVRLTGRAAQLLNDVYRLQAITGEFLGHRQGGRHVGNHSYDYDIAEWKTRSDSFRGISDACVGDATAYGSPGVRDVFRVVGEVPGVLDFAWFLSSDGDDDWQYATIVQREGRLRISLSTVNRTSAEDASSGMSDSLDLVRQMLNWVILQMRYELRVDEAAPMDLPYRPSLFDDY